MSTNPEDVDLGLALGLPNCSIRTRLNNDSSGAGVNAISRADLAFAASDPLSELVWSPHKGLTLKRANSAVADNKPFLLWNVGPSSNLLSPAQYIRTGDDNAVDQGSLSVSQTVLIDSSYMFGDKATLVRPSTTEGGSIMEEEVETGDAIQEEEDRRDVRDEDMCRPENVHIAAIAEMSKNSSGGLGTLANGVSDCKLDMTINGLFSAELIQKAHCSHSNSIEIYASGSGVVGLHVDNPSEPIVTKLSEALVCSLPNFHFQKEPDDELTSATQELTKDKTDKPFYVPPPPLNNMVSSAEDDLCNSIAKQNLHLVEGSQKGRRICLDKEKGKEKVLSDEDICGRSSNDEDNSHESVESCNSAGSFSNGVKRRSNDQGLVLESKRIKESIHGSPGSASTVRPGSTFMNWISNMVKGLSDSNKEESSSLALTLACSYDFYGRYSPEKFPSKKTNDSASLDMGFQTIFQSLSCRNPTISNNEVEKETDSKEESRELVVTDKTSLDDLPGSCEQIGLSNKEVNPVIVGQTSKPRIFSAYIDCSPLARERNLAENKASVERRAILSDSSGEEMNSTAEETTPATPLAMSDVPEKSNPLSNLWITRFSTRAPRLEKWDEITRETNECTTHWPKANSDRVKDDLMLIDQKSSEGRDDFAGIERFNANAEVTVDLKSTSKLCPIAPSQEIRSSEAMASLFARRVNALRHIGPSKGRNTSTSLVTCFFCGSGHDLRECPYVTKAELEDLLLKMSSFDRIEESSCLCIRCSRSDHWAISCPLAPSSSHLRSKRNASSSPSHWTLNAKGYLSKRTESSLGNSVKTNRNSSPSNIVNAQDTVVLSEVFHAIKNLRLSRADILRWVNSDMSLSHLNGFFLRLRLGKMEAGLGEASYYVACITGDGRGHNGCSSKKSILVEVGGIRSSVGSQFVSNQDFLEDEIKAWWCTTVNSGRKIPSLDELNSKHNHRKILGF